MEIAPNATTIPVPRSFLGISTEYWGLPRFERRLRLFERVISVLHVTGNGPFVLRVGGDSADHTFWDLTVHRPPRWVFGLTPAYPTVSRVLSERASAGMAHAVRAVVAFTHRAGLRFRLTEMNSVTCGGRRGVSDTFATALWAPDALFELLRAGVNGVNVHIRDGAINAAFTLGRSGLGTRPLLYGLTLFARTLGPNAELVPLRIHAPGSPHLKVWAVRTRGALHVLLIDKGTRSVTVALRVPAPARDRPAAHGSLGEFGERCDTRRPAAWTRCALAWPARHADDPDEPAWLRGHRLGNQCCARDCP